MSYCGAFPNSESESHLLIDACLARVRRDACLDDDPVLPPLQALIPAHLRREEKDASSSSHPSRFVVSPSAHNLPSAEAIVKLAIKSSSPANVHLALKPASERARATTVPTHNAKKKSLIERMRWPVFLCGFLAGTFGGIAVMKSPIGQQPSVRRAMTTVRSHIVSAYVTTTGAARSRSVSH